METDFCRALAIQSPARIGIRGNHQTDHFLEVISNGNEFRTHKAQCFGVADGLVLGIIVHRFVNSTPHQLGPEPVNEILGEITISGVSDEFRKFLPVLAGFVQVALDIDGCVLALQVGIGIETTRSPFARGDLDGGLRLVKQGIQRFGFPGIGNGFAFHSALALQARQVGGFFIELFQKEGEARVHGLPYRRFFPLGRPQDPIFLNLRSIYGSAESILNPAGFPEKGSQFIKVLLFPVVKWMIVALGALHPDAEEHLGRGRSQGHRVGIVVQDEPDRRQVTRSALGGYELAGKLVKRFVLAD